MDILVYCIKKNASGLNEFEYINMIWFLHPEGDLSPGTGQCGGKLGQSLPKFTKPDCQETKRA